MRHLDDCLLFCKQVAWLEKVRFVSENTPTESRERGLSLETAYLMEKDVSAFRANTPMYRVRDVCDCGTHGIRATSFVKEVFKQDHELRSIVDPHVQGSTGTTHRSFTANCTYPVV